MLRFYYGTSPNITLDYDATPLTIGCQVNFTQVQHLKSLGMFFFFPSRCANWKVESGCSFLLNHSFDFLKVVDKSRWLNNRFVFLIPKVIQKSILSTISGWISWHLNHPYQPSSGVHHYPVLTFSGPCHCWSLEVSETSNKSQKMVCFFFLVCWVFSS